MNCKVISKKTGLHHAFWIPHFKKECIPWLLKHYPVDVLGKPILKEHWLKMDRNVLIRIVIKRRIQMEDEAYYAEKNLKVPTCDPRQIEFEFVRQPHKDYKFS